jgi:hypothetical protein
MSGMHSRRGKYRIAIAAALLAALAGCQASLPRTTTPDRAPPAASPALTDASYDWHGLLAAPFGSVLKEVPLTLHEVLLFRDEAHGAGAADEAECYSGDAPPPRFVGRTPDEYLLCFKQDRLARVQASVRLSAAEAPEIFAAACARWSKQAAPLSENSTPSIATPAAVGAAGAPARAGTGDAAEASVSCEGHDGGVHFSGHLEADTAAADAAPGAQVLSITLNGPAAP